MEETTIDSTVDDSFDIFADDEPEMSYDEPTSEAEDDGFDDSDNAQMEQEPEASTVDNAQPTAEAEALLDIVYNGQPMQLNKQQAVELAQKGMNYDKLQQRLYEAQNSPEKQLITRLAQNGGVTVEALMQSLESQIKDMQLNERANQLMNDSYMDADTARRLAQAEIEKEALQNQQMAEQRQRDQLRQRYEAQQAEAQRRRDAFNKEIYDLCHMYPGFEKKYPTIESMPQQMQDAINNGGSIKSAYQEVLINELRQENAAYKQNQKNAASSAGSAFGTGSSELDDFESALFASD